MINAINVEKLDTGQMNAKKKQPEEAKREKKDAITAKKSATSRNTVLLLVIQNPAVVVALILPDLVLAPAPDLDLTPPTESTRRNTPNPEVVAEAHQRTEIIKRRAAREAPAQAREVAEAALAEAEAQAVVKEVANPVTAAAEAVESKGKKMEKEKRILIQNKP